MVNFKAWFGGSHEPETIETDRVQTLSAIRAERLKFDAMAQRAQLAGDTPNPTFLANVFTRLAEIEQRANEEMNSEELDRLSADAKQQGHFRAYICPRIEIRDEGTLAIDLLEEWSVPKPVIARLRGSLGQKIERADTEQEAARSALRAIFEECDSWETYTTEYEEDMARYTHWLFGSTIAMLLLAIFALHFSRTFIGGLVLAGAAGSCVSVMAKMPVLDVSLSGELDTYGRRIFSRVGVGVIASLIGSALLGWGLIPISIQGQSFATVLDACSTSSSSTSLPTSCTDLKILILLAVPMLFGFSERALTSFEQRVLGGNPKGAAS